VVRCWDIEDVGRQTENAVGSMITAYGPSYHDYVGYCDHI